MGFLDLNVDVVECILAYTDPYDALHLSMTCHDLHQTASKRFVQEIEFPAPSRWKRSILTSPELFERFQAYMFAPGLDRIRHLRSLTLKRRAFCVRFYDDIFDKDPLYDCTLARFLVEVVRNATNLRKLDIYRSDRVLRKVPELADAIASLPGLEEISFQKVNVHSLSVFSHMQSQPRIILCDFRRYFSGQRDTPFRPGRDRLLANFTQSLVTLSLAGGSDTVERLEPGTVWPAVQQLTLRRGTRTNVQALARAFPNLHELNLEYTECSGMVSAPQWPHLDYVVIYSHLEVPLNLAIRRLEICSFLGFAFPRTRVMQNAAMLLQQTQPVVLSCGADKPSILCVAENAGSLRFVKIAYYSETTVEVGWAGTNTTQLLARDVDPLRNLQLKGIAIVVQEGCLRSGTSVMQHAIVVANTIPPLDYVGMREHDKRLSLDRWSVSEPYQWFRVVDRPENDLPVMQALSTEEGNATYVDLMNMPRP